MLGVIRKMWGKSLLDNHCFVINLAGPTISSFSPMMPISFPNSSLGTRRASSGA